jgi:hypothetical protein
VLMDDNECGVVSTYENGCGGMKMSAGGENGYAGMKTSRHGVIP